MFWFNGQWYRHDRMMQRRHLIGMVRPAIDTMAPVTQYTRCLYSHITLLPKGSLLWLFYSPNYTVFIETTPNVSFPSFIDWGIYIFYTLMNFQTFKCATTYYPKHDLYSPTMRQILYDSFLRCSSPTLQYKHVHYHIQHLIFHWNLVT